MSHTPCRNHGVWLKIDSKHLVLHAHAIDLDLRSFLLLIWSMVLKYALSLTILPIALMACSPDGGSPVIDPEAPVEVTTSFRGLIMDPGIVPEVGLLAITQDSFSDLYTAGNMSIVTNADGSVSARTAYVEDIGLSPFVARPTIGSASMNGSYKILSTENIARTDGVTTYDVSTLEGPITVEVNFATGMLTATADDLSVIASIAGTELTGSATHNGVTGDLIGRAGRDTILARDFIYGLFQGASTEEGKAFAGGIKATVDY